MSRCDGGRCSKRLVAALFLTLATACLAGCGEATFSAHQRDNNAEDIRRALAAALALTVAGIVLLPSLGGGILIVLAVMFGLSGMQMLALAVVGEYVSSTLAEVRRRPQYVIEASTTPHGTIVNSIGTDPSA